MEERKQTACEQVSVNLATCLEPEAQEAQREETRAGLESQCLATEMSVPLVSAYEGCVATAGCEAFMGCLDRARKGEVIRRLKARQDQVCERAAAQVTRCAEADMPAEELKRDGPVTEAQRAKHSREFLDQCRQSDMSKRQIDVVASCLSADGCETFRACVDKARRRP